MIVEYALKSPILLSSDGGALGRHLEKCLNIVEDEGLYRQEEKLTKNKSRLTKKKS